MARDVATAPLIGGLGLLERAVGYTLGSLRLVTPAAMSWATPCRDWDLDALLHHMVDSFAALQEAADVGHIDLAPHGHGHGYDSGDPAGHPAWHPAGDHAGHPAWHPACDPAGDPAGDAVRTLRNRACNLLGAWTGASDRAWVSVGGCPLSAGVVSATGALEIAVHGWDVARACGYPRPIPRPLAEELLPLAVLLVTDADRPGRFAAPFLHARPTHARPTRARPAPPEHRLLAFLGRDPG